MANCLKEINAVAAIHIGSSYSTYGFSFIHHWEQTFKKIWNWNGGISWWTKSCLLLKKDFTKSLIGEEAEDKYSELTEDGCQRDYFFFQRLHHNLAVHQYTCCKDIEGQTLEADFVFAHYIKYLKELVQENIEKGFPFNQIPKGEIGYVLIVPDAWRHDSKNYMRDAAVKAGIEKEHFNIVFEREAVAVYCHCIELIEDGHAKTPAPSLDHVKPGTKFMVVDLGYGTTVITVHQKCEDNTLEEVLPASEGPWGGKAVDDQFMKLLSVLVGEEVWENFKRENEKEHLDIIKSLQLKRKEITQKQGKTRIAIPWKLVELCIESYGVDTFNEVIEKNDALKNNVAFVGGKLECDNDIFRNFFRKSVGAIIKTIDEIFQESKARDIETIYMVGEFSNCVLVQDALRNFFVKKTIIVPIEPELAVLKGAVYWGNFLTPFPRRSAMYKHFQKKAKCRKMKRPKECVLHVKKTLPQRTLS